MQIVSVNVGQPREVAWQGKTVRTGIFKSPVAGRVWARALNLDGDGQADLKAHGGRDMAVYLYPHEHYAYWAEARPGDELPWGAFGENLTVTGLDEAEVCLGDRLRLGEAEFQVTQPRVPCFKLGIRFGDPGMVKAFAHSERTGFYCRVLKEGPFSAGEGIERLARDPHGVTVRELFAYYVSPEKDPELARRALAVEALPETWKGHLRERLGR